MPAIQVLDLGRVDYSTALRLQETLVRLRKEGRILDTLLLLEHPPVITLGRNASARNILASEDVLRKKGVEVFEINRGGDVAFHGPGQLVGYPICDLRQLPPRVDPETGEPKRIGAVEFVRRLEESLIRACAEFGVVCKRVPGLTGVWTEGAPEPSALGSASGSAEKKIAAIGVHISRGVTSHGFALNVFTDLDLFKLIVPCGIADKPVTSLEREVTVGAGKPLTMENAAQVLTRQFGSVFGLQILWLESLDSLLKASSAEPANQDVPVSTPEELKRMEEELKLSGRTDVSFLA